MPCNEDRFLGEAEQEMFKGHHRAVEVERDALRKYVSKIFSTLTSKQRMATIDIIGDAPQPTPDWVEPSMTEAAKYHDKHMTKAAKDAQYEKDKS